MTNTFDDWTRLCRLLDDDPELTPATLDSVEAGESPWDALIEGLDDSGALAYLDKRDTGAELADALPALPRIIRTGIELDEVGDINELDRAITSANELLAAHGLTLLYLADPDDEDAHPLVAVPTADLNEINALIEKLYG
ncbi:DUF6630 family protein [Microbacterium sp. A196]|uniref:DUF6630 family protein n=1 Tax=Microbacterium sp. A196 TaxID=3457320 RepID=UPI003FD2037D